MKKKIITTILSALISTSLVACGVNNNTKQTNQTQVTQTQQSQETKKTENITYNFNQEGNSGNFAIKVIEAKETNNIAGKSTSEKFILVKIQIKNVCNQPISYSPNDFRIYDINTNTQYQAHFDTTEEANIRETIYNHNDSFVGMYDNINPNVSKQTYISFEVPKNVQVSNCVLGNLNEGSIKGVVGFRLR